MSITIAKATMQVGSGPPANSVTIAKATMQVSSNSNETAPSGSTRRRQVMLGSF